MSRRSRDSGDVELWALNRANGDCAWKKPIAAGNYRINKQNMSSPSPVTDGTHGLGADRCRHPEGVRLQGHRALDARHPERLRCVRIELGLRVVAAAARRHALRAGAARDEDRRSVLRAEDRRRERQDALEGGAADRRGGRIARRLHDAGAARGRRQEGDRRDRRRRGDRPRPGNGKELWRAQGLNPGKARNYRIVASPLVAGGLVDRATRIRPMLAIKPGGRGDITATHTAWTFDRGPDVPTPVSDGKLLYCVNDRGVVEVLDVRPARWSTVPSA